MKRYLRILYPVLFILLALCCFLGLRYGSVTLTARQIYSAVLGLDGSESSRIILFSLRLPRVLAGLLAGAALSSAGMLLQRVTDNGLCAPNIIGINSGAGFFVMLMLCFFPSYHSALAAAAFIGAASASAVVIMLSSYGRRMSKSTVILAGVALSSLFNAGIAALSTAFPDVLTSYTAFSVGGFSGVTVKQLVFPSIMIAVSLIAAYLALPKLSLLSLGDAMAQSLGVKVKLLRVTILAISALLCAAVVSYAGLLGFVWHNKPHKTEKSGIRYNSCTQKRRYS